MLRGRACGGGAASQRGGCSRRASSRAEEKARSPRARGPPAVQAHGMPYRNWRRQSSSHGKHSEGPRASQRIVCVCVRALGWARSAPPAAVRARLAQGAPLGVCDLALSRRASGARRGVCAVATRVLRPGPCALRLRGGRSEGHPGLAQPAEWRWGGPDARAQATVRGFNRVLISCVEEGARGVSQGRVSDSADCWVGLYGERTQPRRTACARVVCDGACF